MALVDLFKRGTSAADHERLVKRLASQIEFTQKLAGAGSLEELVQGVGEARLLVGAERLTLYTVQDSELIALPPGATGEQSAHWLHIPLARPSLPSHAASSGQTVQIHDLASASELHGISPELSYERQVFGPLHGRKVHQCLCVPLIFKGRTVGVLEATNAIHGPDFDAVDLESLHELARNVAPLLHQVSLLTNQTAKLNQAERLGAIVNRIHSARDVDQILLSVWYDMVQIFDAHRVTIFVADLEAKELVSKVKEEEEISEIRVPIDTASIAGYVASTQQLVNITDVYSREELARIHHDLTFNRTYDEKTGKRTCQVLAAPIVFEGSLQGVLEVINSNSGDPFGAEAEESARTLAQALGIALANRDRGVTVRRSPFDDLLRRKVITPAEIENARRLAREQAQYLEEVLELEYKISPSAILESYARHYRRPAFQYSPGLAVPEALVAQLKDHYLELKSRRWCPIKEEEGKVIVAVDDPGDLVKIDAIQLHFPGLRLDIRVALQQDIVRMIDAFFEEHVETVVAPELSLEQYVEVAQAVIEDEEEERVEVDESDSEVVQVINLLIEKAHQNGASDIHIEPYPDSDVRVRFRIDGQLHQVLTLPRQLRYGLVSRVKIMSELDIAERRKPQDGKIKFRKWGKYDIELRVATLPTAGACEDVVMRILAASKPLPLDQIGMTPRNQQAFIEMVERPYGILLCVGPTGSGKTTTLHSALGHINREGIKIWTAEDPVEITQRGLRQVQVNEKAGLTFPSIMRSFLRADPDVIMVGEMRDYDTARMGIEASLTGHLVLTTLHTNNAPETITRLMNMEVDVFAFGDALLGVLAQRLVRTLCPRCREPYTASAEEFDELRREYGSDALWAQLGCNEPGDAKLFRPREEGCSHCGGRSMRGRMGLHELLVKTDRIRDLVYERSAAEPIRRVALQEGMRTLKQDGIQKVLEGHTTLHEVHRVCSA